MPTAMRALNVRAGAVLVLVGLLAAQGTSFQAQEAGNAPPREAGDQQPPVFRGGVTYVSVDVYPRRDGRVLEGLTADDFEVYEDGVRQSIDRFEFVRVESSPPDAERVDPTSLADGDRQAADPRSRLFVVYLDLANTTLAGGHYAREPIVEFLKRTIGASDLFGVMTAETPAAQLAFGRRLETIEDELRRYWTWGQADRAIVPRSPYEERLANCAMYAPAEFNPQVIERLLITLHRQDQLISSLDNLMQRLGGLRDERKNVLFISEGWVPRGPREELRNFTIGRGRLPQVGVGPGGRLGLGQTMSEDTGDLTWCDAEVQRLGGIDFEMRFRLLLTAARQANVSFYPVDVGGLRTTAPAGGAVDTLRTLAENTDGFAVVGTNDLTGAVRRIEADLSAFYLLGYSSSNTVANGRFREIEVRVTAPDVRVSARRGYFAMTAEMLAAATAAPGPSAPSPVDLALGRLESVRDDADLFVAAAARPHGLQVIAEVSEAAVRRAGWAEGAALEVLVTGPSGQEVPATFELAPGRRRVAAAVPVVGSMNGTWRVLVRGEGREGRLEQHVDIELAGAELVGAPLAWRGMPSPRMPLEPTADLRLSRRERLRVEWPVLAPGLPAGALSARLLDRQGNALGHPLPVSLAGDEPAATIDLPLGGLPEGDYLVQLTASEGGQTERRLLAFRVVR